MSAAGRSRDDLIEMYRRKACHYDLTSLLYPFPGYPVRAQRSAAVAALALRPGDTVVDIACGTGLNFGALEAATGPEGRIIGVDMTDAMLAQAARRVERFGWRNVELVRTDAAGFGFPAPLDAILSTYALTQVAECAAVIARGAAALRPGGRWVVLDVKAPAAPRWATRAATAVIRPFASVDQWMERRPWETIRAAMRQELADTSWTELCRGTAFLAAGAKGPDRTSGAPSPQESNVSRK